MRWRLSWCKVCLGQTKFITLPRQKVEPWLGAEDLLEYKQLYGWLEAQQKLQGYVVLQTSVKPSIWRDCAMTMADKVLYLVDNDEQQSLVPKALEALVKDKAELVICHQASTLKPNKTAHLLQRYEIKRHHHVRYHNNDDVQRLIRDITGESLAVVLGGGGARSFVHIGVLKAMEELGIAVDRIGGTSMGAIVAAQYAAGHSPAELQSLNHEVWVRGKPHKAFTLPITSLLSARRAKCLTQAVFADSHIEDLWLDFFCVSSDLTHLRAHIHDSGVLWSALLASGAIPGVCSSIVSEHGAVLVDGGMLDNLPVNPMKARHQGKVIAVDVTSSHGLKANVDNTIPPNGMRALWDYINPFAKHRRYPHTLKLLAHTASLAAKVNAQASRKVADLCITPTCHQYKAMDMQNLDKLVEVGYQEAIPKLERWLS